MTPNSHRDVALLWLLLFSLPFVGGATCYRQTVPVAQLPPPEVFKGLPSVDELAEVMNRTDGINQLASNSVTLEVPSMSNVPRLSATLAVDRPRNFRMQAKMPIMLGSGLDMGSNQESFWFQVPEGMGQTLYHTTHEQFRRRPLRSILPVEPTWVGDALGLVHLDKAEVVEGPLLRTDGKLEIRTMVQMSDGLYSRVCIIEPTAGYVTDQMLYGANGKMIAASSGSKHRYYEDFKCALPHQVQIRLLPDAGPPLELKLEIGNYVVNQLLSNDPQMFAMPVGASKTIDLAELAPPVDVTLGDPSRSYGNSAPPGVSPRTFEPGISSPSDLPPPSGSSGEFNGGLNIEPGEPSSGASSPPATGPNAGPTGGPSGVSTGAPGARTPLPKSAYGVPREARTYPLRGFR